MTDYIDAREIGSHELLEKLKEMLAAKRGCELDMEILVNSKADAGNVRAFASMSGCSTDIDKKNNYYIIHVKGNICCA